MAGRNGLYWFLVPSLLLLSVVLAYPIGYAVYVSFFEFHLASPDRFFVGLDNYAVLLSDRRLWRALATTVLIAFSGVALEFVLGLMIALALYYGSHGVRSFTILNFLPHVITPVVAALLLRWVFVGRWGLLDSTLAAAGFHPPDWLGDPQWAVISVILAETWKFMPFTMLVLYAGLQSMNRTILEAASIDGASGWRLLWHIILPTLRPVILFVVVIRLMDSFRFFDTVYVLTSGGPGSATETITMFTYRLAFRALEIGRASTVGVLTMLIIAMMVVVVILLMYRKEDARF